MYMLYKLGKMQALLFGTFSNFFSQNTLDLWLVDTADAEGQGTVQNLCSKVTKIRASLVVQWLSICLLMQGILVRSLVWEDPTCGGTTKLMSCNYSACTP